MRERIKRELENQEGTSRWGTFPGGAVGKNNKKGPDVCNCNCTYKNEVPARTILARARSPVSQLLN